MAKLTKLELIGTEELLRKLDENLYADAWSAAFSAVAKWVYAKAQKRAPVGDTGALQAGLRLVIEQSQKIPHWAYVSTSVAGKSGVRYPFVLEAGHRSPKGQGAKVMRRRVPLATGMIELHKRGTNRTTRKWLRGSLGGAKRQMMTYTLAAVKAIEQRWAA